MPNIYVPFNKEAPVFMCLQYRSSENTVGKREIAHNEQLLFLVFSTHLENFLPFSSNLKLLSANHSVWKSLKLVIWEWAKLFLYVAPKNPWFWKKVTKPYLSSTLSVSSDQ